MLEKLLNPAALEQIEDELQHLEIWNLVLDTSMGIPDGSVGNLYYYIEPPESEEMQSEVADKLKELVAKVNEQLVGMYVAKVPEDYNVSYTIDIYPVKPSAT